MKFLHKGKGVHLGHSDTLTLDMIDKSTDMFIAHCDCNNKGGGYNFGNCCCRDK